MKKHQKKHRVKPLTKKAAKRLFDSAESGVVEGESALLAPMECYGAQESAPAPEIAAPSPPVQETRSVTFPLGSVYAWMQTGHFLENPDPKAKILVEVLGQRTGPPFGWYLVRTWSGQIIEANEHQLKITWRNAW